MAEAPSNAELEELLKREAEGARRQGYRWHPKGGMAWRGERPGPDWHFHGYYRRQLWIFVHGQAKKIALWKGRWKKKGTNQTRSSRAPAEEGAAHFSTLIVALQLWGWLCAQVSVLHYLEVLESLEEKGACRRTVQRWYTRALGQALKIQQWIRRAIIEKCEPRSMKQLFPGGLSPPEAWHRRRRRKPHAAESLWRGFAMLFGTALKLDALPSALLTEARRRQPQPEQPLLLN